MSEIKIAEQRNEQVAEYLNNLEIKKTAIGGFDKEDVYACMQELCNLYEESFQALEKQYKDKIEDSDRAKALKTECEQLKAQLQKYEENKETIAAIMLDARKSSEAMVKEAEQKAAQVIKQGQEYIENQQKQQNLLIQKLQEENEKYISYIENLEDGVERITKNLGYLKKEMMEIKRIKNV